MNCIIDSNVLLSALIKDSATRKIIVESGWEFFYPEMSFHEIRKYKELVLKKSGMSEREYSGLLSRLLGYISLVPDEKILENLDEAKKAMQKVDPDDVVFIAACISIEESVIWSDDNHYEKQDRVKFLKTKDMVRILGLSFE